MAIVRTASSTTAAAIAISAVLVHRGDISDVSMPSASSDRYGSSLDHAAMIESCGIHAVIDRKAAADRVGGQGCGFLCGGFVVVAFGRLIFAVVDSDDANIAASCCRRLVDWIGPVAALTET